MSSHDRENLIEEILEAKKTGAFLQYISNVSISDQQKRDQISELLVSIHNNGEINIIDEFEQLKNQSDSAGNFFLTRRILEKILPLLNAPVAQVMNCVRHLIIEAGQDLAGGAIIQPFTDFCQAVPSRVDEALIIILSAPRQYGSLLPAVLLAGASNDIETCLAKAIDLSVHDNETIRSNAVFALGQFPYAVTSEYSQRVIACLAAACKTETNDQVLGNIVRTVCSISISDADQADNGEEILSSALSKGDELTLYTASHVFGFETNKLPGKLLDILLSALIDVNPKHAGTLSNIGYGISCLLKREDPGKGIDFFENLLLEHHGKLTIESLDHLIHSIHSQGFQLLNTLLTRWFLNGEPVLCNSIATILETIHGEEPLLKIDRAAIPSEEPALYLFVARKAIGYLFMKPVTCTSIIVSLMENTHEKGLLQDLGHLLFDPILLNFCGKPYDFLQKEIAVQDPPVRNVIQAAMDAIDDYLETLRSVPDIPEMYPTQEQREVQLRRQGRMMAESYKEARKESIFNQICSTSVLLYGKSSIMHIQDDSGESRRMEIPMQHHSVSFEVPRQADIAPFDFDYQLRVFRSERLVKK